jgi:hypothetical protein
VVKWGTWLREVGMEVAGFYWRGGTVTYEFADTTRISFIFWKKGRILQRSMYIPLGHLSSKVGVIFCSLLFLVPRAAKSKIAGPGVQTIDTAFQGSTAAIRGGAEDRRGNAYEGPAVWYQVRRLGRDYRERRKKHRRYPLYQVVGEKCCLPNNSLENPEVNNKSDNDFLHTMLFGKENAFSY